MVASVDFLIISIIPNLELKSILTQFELQFSERGNFTKRELSKGLYYLKFENSAGTEFDCIVAATYEAGNVTSAIETASLLNRFHPGFAILCGIGGNVFPDRTKKGDVIIAKQVDYERISRVSENLVYGFSPLSIPQPTGKIWKDAIDFFDANKPSFSHENNDFESALLINQRSPKVDFGNIYCSHMVVDCSHYREKIQKRDREMRTVEMEAGGFLLAVEKYAEQNDTCILTMVIRGISDECAAKKQDDASKDVNWRRYAANNCSRSLALYLDSLDEKTWD